MYPSLLGIVGFIATQPIRPVTHQSNHWIRQWYRDNSLVYVSHVHSVWKKENKASKRYGRLIKSDGLILNQMMKDHEVEVTSWMRERVKARGEQMESSGDEDGVEEEGEGEKGESDGDTIDDPAVVEGGASSSAAGGVPHVPSAAVGVGVGTGESAGVGAGPASAPPAVATSGGDVFMTTEQ